MKGGRFIFVIAFASSSHVAAQIAEPGKIINPKPAPIEASAEWQKLAEQYKRQIDTLRAQRGDKKIEAARVQDKLMDVDPVEIDKKALKQTEEAAKETAHGVGDAAVDYFKEFGELSGIVSTAKGIMTDVVPSFKDEIDASLRVGSGYKEQDRLQQNLNDLNDSVKEFDKSIDLAQRNLDLSKKVADIYRQEEVTSRQEKQQIVFKLVNKAKAANQTAATNIQHYQNTVPAGWVACQCPPAHQAVGRWIKGVFYHAPGPQCPK